MTREKTKDAISLLKEDHKKVQQIFKNFEKTADQAAKQELVETACLELTLHTRVEEEIFYPAVREALEDDTLMMDEASVEHQSATQLINTLKAMQPDQEKYEATFMVLGEYVNHHIKEEQDEMFPKVKKARLDLDALGQQIMARKEQLRTEAGMGAL